MGTFDDFRFVRLRYEVPTDKVGKGRVWEPLAKGGAFAKYYSDIHLMLNWQFDGKELGEINLQHNGQVSQVRQASDYWRMPGCTYSKRSQKGFSARALPSNCIITGKGPAILTLSDIPNAYLLGWLNSRLIKFLIELQANYAEFNTGILKKLPWKQPPRATVEKFAQWAAESALELRKLDAFSSELNSFFIGLQKELSVHGLALRLSEERALVYEFLRVAERRWNQHVDKVYGTNSSRLDVSVSEGDKIEGEEDNSACDGDSSFPLDRTATILASYCFGNAFGRWDVRFATGEKSAPELPDPFAPVPVCPPGQLQNEHGLPITKEEVEELKKEGHWNYPIEIPWDGILVDDPGHPLDIEARVHRVLQIIWRDRWEAIEHEACKILGLKSLRDYFRKPYSFFADHLKRYSKSRRQAPIYWPLSTASGSYTLWIYYHRLTDNTLHTALADFIDPKLRSVRTEISSLRESGAHRDRLEDLLDLEKELEDFRTEIARIIKLPWKPNLNDGVLITASPLWKLFRLPKWQKSLKACWEKLEKGDYDWAHLAYSIWPTRVEEVCKTDRSIAIAHGLEHLCIVEAPKPKAKRSKKSGQTALEGMEP